MEVPAADAPGLPQLPNLLFCLPQADEFASRQPNEAVSWRQPERDIGHWTLSAYGG